MKKLLALALAAGAFAAVPLRAQDTTTTVRKSRMDSTSWRSDSLTKKKVKNGRTTVDSAGGQIAPSKPTTPPTTTGTPPTTTPAVPPTPPTSTGTPPTPPPAGTPPAASPPTSGTTPPLK